MSHAIPRWYNVTRIGAGHIRAEVSRYYAHTKCQPLYHNYAKLLCPISLHAKIYQRRRLRLTTTSKHGRDLALTETMRCFCVA